MRNDVQIDGNVAFISLACGAVAKVDSTDLPIISAYRWSKAGGMSAGGDYAAARVALPGGRSTSIYMHRLVTGAPRGTYVDHINGDTLDNRRVNLRLTTNSKNMVNRRGANANSKTGIRGVSVHRCRPSGLLYMARFHKPQGQGYACRSFPFTPGGLVAAAQTVAGFLAGEVTAQAAIPTPEEARVLHARLCTAYADHLALSTRKPKSAEISYPTKDE